MIDFVRINVQAGNGGAGAGSFAHLKGKRYAKADGGDGGRGGNVFIEVSSDLNTLEQYRFVKNFQAQNGQLGSSHFRKGAAGADLVLKVPVGTVVKVGEPVSRRVSEPVSQNSKTPKHRYTDSQTHRITEYDLTESSQKVLVARGGEGGRGNAHLRDEFGRRPRFAEAGQPGELRQITLELKLIADVGIIGLPNCGKSTLLAALTKAIPKIAPYPFTTLAPNLGVLAVKVESQLSRRLVIADIPGLIEGASEGHGLGDLFLRHIERTKILMHLIDASAHQHLDSHNVNGNVSSFWQDYQIVRNELKKYSKDLITKKEIIILNKIDLVSPKFLKAVVAEFARHRKKVISICAKTGQGLENLRQVLNKLKI